MGILLFVKQKTLQDSVCILNIEKTLDFVFKFVYKSFNLFFTGMKHGKYI